MPSLALKSLMVHNKGLEHHKEHGFRTKPFSRLNRYLFPELVDQIAVELPTRNVFIEWVNSSATGCMRKTSIGGTSNWQNIHHYRTATTFLLFGRMPQPTILTSIFLTSSGC